MILHLFSFVIYFSHESAFIIGSMRWQRRYVRHSKNISNWIKLLVSSVNLLCRASLHRGKGDPPSLRETFKSFFSLFGGPGGGGWALGYWKMDVHSTSFPLFIIFRKIGVKLVPFKLQKGSIFCQEHFIEVR